VEGRDLNFEGKGMRVWWGTKGVIEPYLEKKPGQKVVPLHFVVGWCGMVTRAMQTPLCANKANTSTFIIASRPSSVCLRKTMTYL
jgi:hypothetical protein